MKEIEVFADEWFNERKDWLPDSLVELAQNISAKAKAQDLDTGFLDEWLRNPPMDDDFFMLSAPMWVMDFVLDVRNMVKGKDDSENSVIPEGTPGEPGGHHDSGGLVDGEAVQEGDGAP